MLTQTEILEFDQESIRGDITIFSKTLKKEMADESKIGQYNP